MSTSNVKVRAVKRKVSSSNYNNPSNNISKDGPTKVEAFKLELLDCPICFAPFTIPIFQCENGHTACSSCCQNLARKCPSCSLPIGSIRCRAIENVLESTKLCCRNEMYGCRETFYYGETYLEHGKTCASAPCACPIPGCESMYASYYLYSHFSHFHDGCMIKFKYDHTLTVSFTNDDKFLVLGVDGLNYNSLFLLNNNKMEQSKNVVTVSRIAPSSSKESYCYDLAAKVGGTHTFRSYTKNIPSKFEDEGAPSFGFLLDLVCAAGHNGKTSLDICIWNKGSRPSAIPSSAPAT